MDSPEEMAVFIVGVLVRRDNIASQREQMARHPRNDTGPIDT
jgi:hypothetical protein